MHDVTLGWEGQPNDAGSVKLQWKVMQGGRPDESTATRERRREWATCRKGSVNARWGFMVFARYWFGDLAGKELIGEDMGF